MVWCSYDLYGTVALSLQGKSLERGSPPNTEVGSGFRKWSSEILILIE